MTSGQTSSGPLQGSRTGATAAGPAPRTGAATGAKTFFERYFEFLDGPEPHSSLDLVADDVEFSIQWAGDTRKSSQFLGGMAELRGFIDAGDMGGWAHYVSHSGVDGDIEFALGETRWDSGERIGTFLAVAELDATGRMRRYMVARTPALAFSPVTKP